MQIAAYVNAAGELAGFSPEGAIRVYDETTSGWRLEREFRFGVAADMNLVEIKAALRKAAALLGGCRTVVFGETRGLLYAILAEELGFRVWKSEGLADDRLDAVAARQAEADEAARTAPPPPPRGGGCGCGGGGGRGGSVPVVLPERMADGAWRIDLAAALAADPARNSHDTLMPLLQGCAWLPLEIRCDHLPRWFDGALVVLGLSSEVHHRTDGGLTVTVSAACGSCG